MTIIIIITSVNNNANPFINYVYNKGPTDGFIVTNIIDNLRDTEGYIGYLPSDKSIYVVFRGSISIRNWLTDLNALKTPYLTFPECNYLFC